MRARSLLLAVALPFAGLSCARPVPWNPSAPAAVAQAPGRTYRWTFDAVAALPDAPLSAAPTRTFLDLLGGWRPRADAPAPSAPNVYRPTRRYAVAAAPRVLVSGLTFADHGGAHSVSTQRIPGQSSRRPASQEAPNLAISPRSRDAPWRSPRRTCPDNVIPYVRPHAPMSLAATERPARSNIPKRAAHRPAPPLQQGPFFLTPCPAFAAAHALSYISPSHPQ